MRFARRGQSYAYIVSGQCGEPVDVFFAFTHWRGSFWSAHRRHVMFGPHEWETQRGGYVSDVWLTQWVIAENGDLVPGAQQLIGSGTDPRIALVGGRPVVLYRGALHSEHEYYAFDVEAGRLVVLSCDEDWFAFGKNWAPLEMGGALAAAHGLAPFKTYRIDLASGLCASDIQVVQPVAPPAAHDRYNMLRGGSNALPITEGRFAGGFVALGHMTMEPWRHYPFTWRATAQGDLEFDFTQDFAPLTARGYGIIDPTSLCRDDQGAVYVGLCATERDWFFDQEIANLLVPGDLSTNGGVPRLAVDVSACNEARHVLRFMAVNLPCHVANDEVPYGARRINGAGYALLGPYCRLPAGRYRMTVRYRASAPADSTIGTADMGASKPSTYHKYEETAIPGSAGAIAALAFDFFWPDTNGEVFALRVHISEAGAVVLYDICIETLSERE